MILIVFCYYRISVVAREQSKTIASQSVQLASEGVRNRKNAKTVGFVVTLFVISWFPSLVTSFVHLATSDDCTKRTMRLVWLWVELIAFSSSGINPWLYSLRNRYFRQEMSRVFRIRCFASQRRISFNLRPKNSTNTCMKEL